MTPKKPIRERHACSEANGAMVGKSYPDVHPAGGWPICCGVRYLNHCRKAAGLASQTSLKRNRNCGCRPELQPVRCHAASYRRASLSRASVCRVVTERQDSFQRVRFIRYESLCAQRLHGIHRRGAACGDEAGHERRDPEQHSDRGERRDIPRTHTEEQPAHESCGTDRAGQTSDDSENVSNPASLRMSWYTELFCAPSAMRTPISRVRWLTE